MPQSYNNNNNMQLYSTLYYIVNSAYMYIVYLLASVPIVVYHSVPHILHCFIVVFGKFVNFSCAKKKYQNIYIFFKETNTTKPHCYLVGVVLTFTNGFVFILYKNIIYHKICSIFTNIVRSDD